jgi:hypothetical protein
MKIKELLEGLMKRPDPFISGEHAPTDTHQMFKNIHDNKENFSTDSVNKSFHASWIKKLANQANVSLAKAEKAWNEAKATVDENDPKSLAIITQITKKALGLI